MFVTKKQMEAEIKRQMDALKDACLADMEAHKQAITASIDQAITLRTAAEKQKRYESEEPYVEIVCERLSTDGSVELNLDWNDAFIRLLKTKGYKAPTEDKLIELWMASLSQNTADNIGKESFQ
jgi:hypothetical protein